MTEKLTTWGLDVSKDNVCAHRLTCFPEFGVNNAWHTEYRHLKPEEFNQCFPRFYLYPKKDKNTIREWLAMVKPGDVVVMEPTGVHPAYLWAKAAKLAGCIVAWVGHAQLAGYRSGKNLPEKSDAADALCLAAYFLDPEHQLPGKPGTPNPRWFLTFDIEAKVYPLAQICAYLRHLNRAKHPNEAYIKQLLSWQFPEVAFSKSQPGITGVRPLYAWLAEREDLQTKKGKTQYDNKWRDSIARELSLEPDWYCRTMAQWLVDGDLMNTRLLNELTEILKDPCFEPYLKIFESLGMGEKEFVPVLIAIYPFESFLVEGRRHKINGADLSLRAFKHRIGQGGFFKVSGDKGKYVKGGSGNARQAMWNWIYRAILPVKNRPTTGLGKSMADYYAELEQRFAPGQPEREHAISQFKQTQSQTDKNKGGKRARGRMTGENIVTGLLVAKTQSRLANVLYRELCKVFIQ